MVAAETLGLCRRKKLNDVDEVCKLISLYRANECLWNPKSPHYFNLSFKEKAWHHISLFFNDKFNVDQLKMHMLSLRYYYETERLFMDRCKQNGLHYVPQISYFQKLQFLSDTEVHNEEVESIESEENLCNSETNCIVEDAFLLSSSEKNIRSEHVDFQMPSLLDEDCIINGLPESIYILKDNLNEQLSLPPSDTKLKHLGIRIVSGNDNWYPPHYNIETDDDYYRESRVYHDTYNSRYEELSDNDYLPPSTYDILDNGTLCDQGASWTAGRSSSPTKRKVLTGRYKISHRHHNIFEPGPYIKYVPYIDGATYQGPIHDFDIERQSSQQTFNNFQNDDRKQSGYDGAEVPNNNVLDRSGQLNGQQQFNLSDDDCKDCSGYCTLRRKRDQQRSSRQPQAQSEPQYVTDQCYTPVYASEDRFLENNETLKSRSPRNENRIYENDEQSDCSCPMPYQQSRQRDSADQEDTGYPNSSEQSAQPLKVKNGPRDKYISSRRDDRSRRTRSSRKEVDQNSMIEGTYSRPSSRRISKDSARASHPQAPTDINRCDKLLPENGIGSQRGQSYRNRELPSSDVKRRQYYQAYDDFGYIDCPAEKYRQRSRSEKYRRESCNSNDRKRYYTSEGQYDESCTRTKSRRRRRNEPGEYKEDNDPNYKPNTEPAKKQSEYAESPTTTQGYTGDDFEEYNRCVDRCKSQVQRSSRDENDSQGISDFNPNIVKQDNWENGTMEESARNSPKYDENVEKGQSNRSSLEKDYEANRMNYNGNHQPHEPKYSENYQIDQSNRASNDEHNNEQMGYKTNDPMAQPRTPPKEYDQMTQPRTSSPEYEQMAQPRTPPKEYDQITQPRTSPQEYDQMTQPRSPPQEYDQMAQPRSPPQEYDQMAQPRSPPREYDKMAQPRSPPNEYDQMAQARSPPQEYDQMPQPRSPPQEYGQEKTEKSKAGKKSRPRICYCEAAVETDIDMTLNDRNAARECICDQLYGKARTENEPGLDPNTIRICHDACVAKIAPMTKPKIGGRLCRCTPPLFQKFKQSKPGLVSKPDNIKNRSPSRDKSRSKRNNKTDDDNLSKFQASGGQSPRIQKKTKRRHKHKTNELSNKKNDEQSQTNDGVAILCSHHVKTNVATKTMNILRKHIKPLVKEKRTNTKTISLQHPEALDKTQSCWELSLKNGESSPETCSLTSQYSDTEISISQYCSVNASKRDIIILHPPVLGFRPSKYSCNLQEGETNARISQSANK